MIVVSDTTPLISLLKINRIEAPYTERYVRCCERTGVSHSLLLD